MPRSKSSKTWLKEHFDDPYVKQAQAEGYRSRAIYKLMEVDQKENLLKQGMTIIDLGAAPGGWTQYVSRKLSGKGTIIALDCLPMDALEGVEFILGDFREDGVLTTLLHAIPKAGVDVILSDMAPNMSGTPAVDMPRAVYLIELAFDLAEKVLKPNGMMFVKMFHGEGFDDLVKLAKTRFQKVVIRKPSASRSRSRETYMLAQGYKVV